MKKLVLLTLTALLVMSLFGPAGAVVLTFDELSGGGAMPSPYQGIISWEIDSWFYYDAPQAPYTPHSDPTRIYTLSDYTPSWDFLTPVVYDGSWFSGYADATVQMELYYQGNLMHSTGILAPSSTPAFLATGYSGLVDRVVINTPRPDFWVMDDLTYNQAPLPGALWLLGSGLLGLAGLRGFRRS